MLELQALTNLREAIERTLHGLSWRLLGVWENGGGMIQHTSSKRVAMVVNRGNVGIWIVSRATRPMMDNLVKTVVHIPKHATCKGACYHVRYLMSTLGEAGIRRAEKELQEEEG